MPKMRFTDLLLFPASLYRRFTDNRYTAVPGFLAIGAIDVIVPLLVMSPEIFIGKAGADLGFNIALALLAAVLVGIADVVFFTLPLYDTFAWIGRRNKVDYSGISPVKPAKAYMMAHTLIIPLNMALMSLTYFTESTVFYAVLDIYFTFIVPFWFAAVIYRGINSMYTFVNGARKIAFILILIWSLVLSYALEYIVSGLLVSLFR